MGYVEDPQTGAPLKYKTIEDLEQAIEDYFNNITISNPRYTYKEGIDAQGNKTIDEIPVLNNAGDHVIDIEYTEKPSIMAMCVFLGIRSQTLTNYEQRGETFIETITRAKERILAFKLGALYWVKNPRGVMFDLNVNHGLVERTAQDIKHTGIMPVQIVDDIK